MSDSVWTSTAPWRCSSCGATRVDVPIFWQHAVRVGKKVVDCDGWWVSFQERLAIRAAFRLGGHTAAFQTMLSILKPKLLDGRLDREGWDATARAGSHGLQVLCYYPPDGVTGIIDEVVER